MTKKFRHVYDKEYDLMIYYVKKIVSRKPKFHHDGIMIWLDKSKDEVIQIAIFNYKKRMFPREELSIETESLLKEIPPIEN